MRRRAATVRGRVLGVDHDPQMVRRAAERAADLPGTAGYLTPDQARDGFDHPAHGPLLASVTVFVAAAERADG